MLRTTTLKVFASILILAYGSGSAWAQSEADDLIYRFTVEGISDPVAAKPIQVALMEEPWVTVCLYFEGCDCFKVTLTEEVGYATLRSLLHEQGYQLTGEVMVSDGRILTPAASMPEEP